MQKPCESAHMPPFCRADRQHNRALRLASKGRFEDAARQFEHVLELRPADPALHLNYGLALAELGRYEESVGTVQQAARLDPSNAVFPMFLGTVHLDFGHSGRAAQALEKSLELDPENALAQAYRLLAGWDQGAAEESARELAKQEFPLSTRFEARLLLRLEQQPGWTAIPSREQGADSAASRAGRKSKRLSDKALALAAHGRFEKVLQLIEEAAEMSPRAPHLAAAAGEVCDKAQQAMEAMPEDRRQGMLHAMGCACFTAGLPERGAECMLEWLKAQDARPDGPGGGEDLQVALYVLASGELAGANNAGAAKHLERLRSMEPEEPAVELMLGKALVGVGETAGARRAFERLLGLSPLYARQRLREVVEAKEAATGS